MKWNLRMTAANRGIWKASELHRKLAEHGLEISTGKMSGWWSGNPASIKLDEIDVICTALECTVADLMIAEPVAKSEGTEQAGQTAVGQDRRVTPRPRTGRSLPPL
ncbi:XRE family transcriptional regulator [Pseudonocardiaceae bacterium YIM PH 21723]|nr:XRE family transcriptional regulator [Pseudonocardiaceae bacterium YIM PH 21723]